MSQLVEAAAAAVEQYDPSKDPKRRPSKSKDPAWKYEFWPELEKKDLLQCKLCNKKVYVRVARMKRHFGGGFSDVENCPNATSETGGRGGDGEDTVQQQGSCSMGSASTKRKEPMSSFHVSGQPQKHTKTLFDMVRKTPEEVVSERHSSSTSQTTLEHCTKRTK